MSEVARLLVKFAAETQEIEKAFKEVQEGGKKTEQVMNKVVNAITAGLTGVGLKKAVDKVSDAFV